MYIIHAELRCLQGKMYNKSKLRFEKHLYLRDSIVGSCVAKQVSGSTVTTSLGRQV